MDYSKIGEHIAVTIHNVGGKELTHNQHMAMVGAISVWIEKATMAERERCAKIVEEMMATYHDVMVAEAIRSAKP